MTPRLTYFVSTESQPRVRRAADAVKVIVGLLLVIWGMLGVDRHPPWEQALTDLIGLLPSWATSLFSMGYLFGFFYGLSILVAIVAGGRERRGALRDVALALVIAGAAGALLGFALTGSWPYVIPELGLENPVPRFPVLRVVLVTATLVAASPHLSRPMRRLGWVTMVITAVGGVGLGYGDPSDAVGALGIGLVAAGAVLMVAGSPRGYPDPASVAEAMAAMGLKVSDIRIDPEQSWGVRRFDATTADGRPVAIVVYGRDASDSQLMAKVWRTLWYREGRQTLGYSRLQAVEHEALVTMLAARAGARVPEVLAVGRASSEIALLAVEANDRSLADADVGDISDEFLVGVWRDVDRLHSSSISHGSLSAAAIDLDTDGHLLRNFALGSVAAGDADRSHDVVGFLFSLSLLIGAERAVVTAATGLGEDALTAALPYLQLPAIDTETRKRAEKPKEVIKELQTAVVAATGKELPEPVKLRRVSGRNLMTAGLLVFAAFALLPLLAGIDYAAVWDELQTATWSVLVLGLVVGQMIFLPQATATMFAVPRALPFWPLVILQTASKFVGLAIPSAAGRVAMNAAFLHKFGVSITVAVAQGAIDGFSGFMVQCSILIIAFLSSDVELDLDTGDTQWGLILLVVVLVAVGAVIAVFRVRKLRDRVIPVAKQGWGALATVLREPRRAFGLLGSNLVYWLLLGMTLWLLLEAIGVQIGFGTALIVAVATDLLGGFVPVPGGIGVAEAVMTGFLAAVGVDQSAAFAATICYRFITFYLPAIEGYFGTKWLERNEYL